MCGVLTENGLSKTSFLYMHGGKNDSSFRIPAKIKAILKLKDQLIDTAFNLVSNKGGAHAIPGSNVIKEVNSTL